MRPIDELFPLLRRWRDDRTLLRVDGRLDNVNISLEAVVSRVEDPLVGLLLLDCGFIEFTLDSTWQCEFGAPDAMRVPPDERIGESPSASKHYKFGEMIAVANPSGLRLIFVELVRRID